MKTTVSIISQVIYEYLLKSCYKKKRILDRHEPRYYLEKFKVNIHEHIEHITSQMQPKRVNIIQNIWYIISNMASPGLPGLLFTFIFVFSIFLKWWYVIIDFKCIINDFPLQDLKGNEFILFIFLG